MLNIPPGINHDEALENEARRLERERILLALNGDLSWCQKDGADYRNCIDFTRLQKIVLNQ